MVEAHSALETEVDSLQAIFHRILQLQLSYSKDNTHEMQERGRLIRKVAPPLLAELLPSAVDLDPADLTVEGRDGTGLKTRVPWVRVYSTSRSPSATKGWYVVYLFSSDGSAVYLSLNQGTTTAQGGAFKGRSTEFLEQRVTWARKILQDQLESLDSDELDLADPGALGGGYEKGDVVSKAVSG